ncbi:D-aminoacyl-tRNA deacylase [Paludibacter jiangxiensis]|uniref:D-aminoacyl-tRNA deacylase n=1 Tax=Paludibacter jiangxiensis TaxID=681398 RepID=A0A161LHZ5_9BACT|nr:D-aminoacyl-tRNA deacylase [Paludibacter jiangxiensis]GAT61896.1 D-tyrosyl-tRNA(Tyr) deacylase [Paludibacter jiangxiensis]
MRLVIQRVKHASVTVEGTVTGKIGEGLLVLVGIEDTDTPDDSQWLAGKLVNLRIFDDEDGVMNRSVKDINGGILIVSQFTLMASTKKGNRPSYIRASKHEFAVPMYEQFCENVRSLLGKPVQTGIFAADMQVELLNNGPVTIFIDSHLRE